MNEELAESMRYVAGQCVSLVADEFGRELDYSLDSLDVLDGVCAELIADGPLPEERLDLWWKLAGAYTGEAVVRVHGGQWIEHERGYAVQVGSITAMPFNTAARVLEGEDGKSLGSFGRALPAIVAHSQQAAD